MGSMTSWNGTGTAGSGYLAVPEDGSGPGVIVIQEWWGLVPHITDVCDRYAAEGFMALAPDLRLLVDPQPPAVQLAAVTVLTIVLLGVAGLSLGRRQFPPAEES